jgi:hypothetical protein
MDLMKPHIVFLSVVAFLFSSGLANAKSPGAVCVSNVCENYAANGVSCTGNDMCYSGYCGTSGGCQQPLPCQPTAH